VSVPESPFERGSVVPPDDEAIELAQAEGVRNPLALWDVAFVEVVVGAKQAVYLDRAVGTAHRLPLDPAHLSAPVFAFGEVDELLMDRLAALTLGTIVRTQDELDACSNAARMAEPLDDRGQTAWRAPFRDDGVTLICMLNAWGKLCRVELDTSAKLVDVEPVASGYRVGILRPQAMCADGRPPIFAEAYAELEAREGDELAPETWERLADLYPTVAAAANRAGVLQALKRRDYPRAIELVRRATELDPDNEHYRRNLDKIEARARYKRG
jgi:tetratricopeptide (TPR) repeat protein